MSDAPFRTATLADAPAIRRLVRAAYAKWVPVIGREPLPMLVDYEEAVEASHIALHEAAGRLLGLIQVMQRQDHLWIENVAVAPEAQGQGIGRRLLAHAEVLALAAGLPELRLLTNEAFAANVALYQRLGFTITRREPFLAGTTLHLTRQL